MDTTKLWWELFDLHLLLLLALAALLGAIGATLHPSSQEPSDQAAQPRRSRGWDIAAGSLAALAMLYLVAPTSATALIAGSMAAGYAANAVLAGFEARVKVAQMQTRAAAAAQRAEEEQRRANNIAQEARAREDTARRTAYALDEIARAAERGGDVRPIIHDLRVKRVLPAEATP